MPAESLPPTAAALAEWRCDTADLVMFHRFLRTMFHDAIGLMERVDDGDRRQAARVAEHVRQIALALHTHHHGEDVFVWDDLAARAPACILHVSQMRAQHVEIEDRLTQLDGALAPWSASGATVDAEAPLAAIAELNASLDRHLGQEEQQILPVAAVSFTQAEWDRLAEHGRASVPRGWAFTQLGFMLDTMPEGEREEFLYGLPRVIRLLWSSVGRAQYRRHRARLYGRDAVAGAS